MILASLTLLWSSSSRAVQDQDEVTQLLSPRTRLVVFSPHPDDETLGAGGLIRRVLQRGGRVKVAYLTSGDGYPEGIFIAEHLAHPSAQDFRSYGERRQREVVRALATLGVSRQDITFFGFPDRGLYPILQKYWDDHPPYYTSPYTQEDHPPSVDEMLPHTEYDGEDLTREIDEILREFRPTLLAVTLPQDQHPDHCATYFFARRALEQLEKKEPTLHPIILAFLIHFGQWPVEDGANSRSPLLPPAGFPGTKATWSLLPLTSSETDAKRLALLQYQSQMLVMGSYLMSFVRSNEIFLLDPPTPGNLQSQQLCGGQ